MIDDIFQNTKTTFMFFSGKARHDKTSQTKNGPKWTKMDIKRVKVDQKMDQSGHKYLPKMDQKIDQNYQKNTKNGPTF